jgi:hypothetical protein
VWEHLDTIGDVARAMDYVPPWHEPSEVAG